MMANNKRKLIVLAVISVLLLLIAWRVAITPTLKLRKSNKQLEKEIVDVKTISSQIQFYKHSLDEIKLTSGWEKQKDIEQVVFDYFSDYCNRKSMLLMNFPEPHVFANDDYEINTWEIQVKGSYFEILRLADSVERNLKSAKFIGLQMTITKKPGKKQEFLIGKFYIQSTNSI